jgi:Fe/S biogenesis protein NfuA
MIQVHDSAQQYFKHLIEQQDAEDLGLHITVSQPGTPGAACELSFCLPDEISEVDSRIQYQGFDLYVDSASEPWLENAELEFVENATGGELVVKAPNIKGQAPAEDSPLAQRVQYVLDAHINPSVAAHGGVVSLVDVNDQGVVVLQFGGGCHGCGQVGVTLKEGVEKTLREAIPEVTAVRDVTDHSTGENPYYQ